MLSVTWSENTVVLSDAKASASSTSIRFAGGAWRSSQRNGAVHPGVFVLELIDICALPPRINDSSCEGLVSVALFVRTCESATLRSGTPDRGADKRSCPVDPRNWPDDLLMEFISVGADRLKCHSSTPNCILDRAGDCFNNDRMSPSQLRAQWLEGDRK